MTTLLPVVSAAVLPHELLCAALFYLTFCRAVWAGRRTSIGMHTVIRVMGAVSCMGMTAPLAFGYEPDWFSVTLLALVVLEVRLGRE